MQSARPSRVQSAASGPEGPGPGWTGRLACSTPSRAKTAGRSLFLIEGACSSADNPCCRVSRRPVTRDEPSRVHRRCARAVRTFLSRASMSVIAATSRGPFAPLAPASTTTRRPSRRRTDRTATGAVAGPPGNPGMPVTVPPAPPAKAVPAMRPAGPIGRPVPKQRDGEPLDFDGVDDHRLRQQRPPGGCVCGGRPPRAAPSARMPIYGRPFP